MKIAFKQPYYIPCILPEAPRTTMNNNGTYMMNTAMSSTFGENTKSFAGNDYPNYNHDGLGTDRCLTDLRQTDPRHEKIRIEKAKGGLLRDSYYWIFDHIEFKRWRNDPQCRLLWVKGDPGKGKTMLLCGIIDEMKKRPEHRLSYFFCQATETALSSSMAVLRGLIYLLVVQEPSLLSLVQSHYGLAGKRLFEDHNDWEALSGILLAILSDPMSSNLVLIVDALDECLEGLPRLLDLIVSASSTHQTKWIISSRNWPNIEKQLVNTEHKAVLCLELNQDSTAMALQAYIKYKANQLAQKRRLSEETHQIVAEYLISNAQNTFLWVALVYQELSDPQIQNRHISTKLRQYPPGLDSLYKRMMDNLCGSVNAETYKQILALSSIAYRPLALNEMACLIASLDDLSSEEAENVIRSCRSFFTFQDGIINFVHQSAKDYLLQKASPTILPLGLGHLHYTLASRSLIVLSRNLRRDIYNLQAPGFPIEHISPPNPDPLVPIHYACVFWVHHLCSIGIEQLGNGSEKLHIQTAMTEFLKKSFLNWLEALVLLKSLSEGLRGLEMLEGLAVSNHATGALTMELNLIYP